MNARALVSIACLALPAVAVASQSAATGPHAAAAGSLRLAIQVPKLLNLRVLGQPDVIEVTAADLERGFLVARGVVDVLSTHRNGYQVRAQLAAGPVVAARLDGLERPVHAGSDDAPVPMPSMVGKPRPAPYAVEYRLTLAPGTAPGRYAWPLSLSLEEP